MPKNKRPVPRKSSEVPEHDDEALALELAELALKHGPENEDDIRHLIRNALRKKHDDVLYGAIEHARYVDPAAYQWLRGEIEEAAATVLLRREGKPAMEVNAFAVPLFVHSKGGLKEAEGFQDGDAHEALVDSFYTAQLESKDAKVVLVSHAYDLAEFDALTYSQVNDLAREAAITMTEKKLTGAPLLERSMAGWHPFHFGADDKAVELRFLLGFALKREDDAFYAVPQNEAKADAYFEARMARYRDWTAGAAPLVARCMADQPETIDVHFLYQDLFFGAKELGLAELAMLGLISEINGMLEEQGLDGASLQARVDAAAEEDELVLRVSLHPVAGGPALASFDKPLDVAADLQGEVDDVFDALATLGIRSA